MELSKRLQAVAGFVSEGNRLVDVGTDHGYIPIYLVKTGKIPSAIAMDVKKGPLSRAEEHIGQAGLDAYIECRLSDGLRGLKPGEGESLLLAGMGGNLMIRILMERPDVLASFQELVLQPQSAWALVRKEAEALGWCVDREDMVLEDGKFYPMLRLVPAGWIRRGRRTVCAGLDNKNERNDGKGKQKKEDYCGDDYKNQAEYFYGKLLLRNKHPVLKEYLERQQKLLLELDARLKSGPEEARSESARERLAELERETAVLKEALSYYYK